MGITQRTGQGRRIATMLTIVATTLAVVAVAHAPRSAAAHAGPARAYVPTLYAKVGPGFAITLKTAKGAKVTKVKAGTTYSVLVVDASDVHNFHLVGKGVNVKTSITGTTKGTRWKVTFAKGTYTYKCDPHAEVMKGSFTAA